MATPLPANLPFGRRKVAPPSWTVLPVDDHLPAGVTNYGLTKSSLLL